MEKSIGQITKELARKNHFLRMRDFEAEYYIGLIKRKLPSWLCVAPEYHRQAIYSENGSLIARGHNGVVIWEYGAFVQIQPSDICRINLYTDKTKDIEEMNQVATSLKDLSEAPVLFQQDESPDGPFTRGMCYVDAFSVRNFGIEIGVADFNTVQADILVNVASVFGSVEPTTQAFSAQYPVVNRAIKRAREQVSLFSLLGKTISADLTGGRKSCSVVAQLGFGAGDACHMDYDALKTGLTEIASVHKNASIALPYLFGTETTNADWGEILKIIGSTLVKPDNRVFLCVPKKGD